MGRVIQERFSEKQDMNPSLRGESPMLFDSSTTLTNLYMKFRAFILFATIVALNTISSRAWELLLCPVRSIYTLRGAYRVSDAEYFSY